MWCYNCHTFWDWNTLQTIKSSSHAPHNPDHRQWLSTSTASQVPPRELGDLPCGGIITPLELHDAIVDEFTFSGNFDILHAIRILLNARGSVEFAHTKLRVAYPLVNDYTSICRDLRIMKLMGDIDEENFRKRVVKRHRATLSKQDVGPIVECYTFAGIDILLRLSQHAIGTENAWIEFEGLRSIVNSALSEVSRAHDRKIPYLSHDFVWITPYSR